MTTEPDGERDRAKNAGTDVPELPRESGTDVPHVPDGWELVGELDVHPISPGHVTIEDDES